MTDASIVICDDERSYALHLMEYLKNKGMPYEICAFFSTGRLLSKACPENTALLIIAESEYTADIVEKGYRCVLILNETDQWLGQSVPNISKYQSMEVVSDKILELCIAQSKESGTPLPQTIRHGHAMKIIGVYTPVTRCLQTTVSLTLGQLLARGHKTLYMNFENYSGLSRLLAQNFRGSVSDLIFYNEVARKKFASQLGLMTIDVNGLSVLPPMHSFIELQSIRSDQWIALFNSIEQVSEYEYLILDLSESTAGLLDILRECTEVITIIRPGCLISEAKMQEYRAILQEKGYEDVYAKTRRWQLPVFREIPADFTGLTQTELAARMRKMMAETLHL